MTIENRFKGETDVYSDLLESTSKIHYWNSPEIFPVDKVDTTARERLKDVIAIEHSFRGIQKDRELFDQLFEVVYSRIGQYFRKLNMPSYIFTAEYKAEVRNRVRSHKGIIANKSFLSSGLGIQSEVILDDKYTLFGAVLKLVPDNLNEVLDLFMDRSRSFIISTNRRDIMTDEFIGFTVNMMDHKGNSSINYLKLLSELCVSENLIHRMGGDGGDTEVDFQIFTRKENESLAVSSLS